MLPFSQSFILHFHAYFNVTEAQPSPNGIVANGQSPHFRLAQTLQQRTNEITPQQHSMKRKMTGITNCTPETQLYRQRQIKHLTDKPLELAPNSITCIEPANSSDEENALMVCVLHHSIEHVCYCVSCVLLGNLVSYRKLSATDAN